MDATSADGPAATPGEAERPDPGPPHPAPEPGVPEPVAGLDREVTRMRDGRRRITYYRRTTGGRP